MAEPLPDHDTQPSQPVTGGGVSGRVIHFPGRQPEDPMRVGVRQRAGAPARASIPPTVSDDQLEATDAEELLADGDLDPKTGLAAGIAAAFKAWYTAVLAEARSGEARRNAWADPSESLKEHWDYIWAGAWSDTPFLLLLGRSYGLVAFPVRALLLGPAWLLARPSRLFVATVIAVAVYLTI